MNTGDRHRPNPDFRCSSQLEYWLIVTYAGVRGLTLRSKGGTIMPPQECLHINAVNEVKLATERVCEECVKIGSTWVHLRTCQECGGTRCCDSSPNRHATKHAHATAHPVIASAEPGERWLYCYPDDVFVEY